MYSYMTETWQELWKEKRHLLMSRLVKWRREPAIVRLDKPIRIDRARRVGYKDKPGMVVLRVRVGRKAMRRQRPRAGRRQKALGVKRRKVSLNYVEVALQRARKRYPNLVPLGGYKLFQDGRYVFVELICVDPRAPQILSDRELKHRLGKRATSLKSED
ncbi:MAG: 50S ribosomal protein L15 [Nitrososphaerota archaeon]